MKKLLTVMTFTGILLSITSNPMAGGIANKQNFSTEYLRTFSRNAAVDSADAVAYNPAGVTMLPDGIYINANAFYAMKDYSNTINGVEYASDEPSIVPGFFGLYKRGRIALFGALTIPGGGGKVKYENGNATTLSQATLITAVINESLTYPPPAGYSLPPAYYYDTVSSQNLQAESIYYGYTLGFTYELIESFSIALGARYIDADKDAKASMTISPSTTGVGLGMTPRTFNLDYKETSDGWGGIIGISITPKGPYNIGIRYETKTKLDFKTTVNRDDTGRLANGSLEREDLPGLFAVGVGYRLNPSLMLDTSFTYYLEKDAVRENSRFKGVDNGYDLAVALEYGFNERLKVSAGYMFTNTGISPDNMLPEAPELDAHTICGGLAYAIGNNLEINIALMRAFYDSEIRSDRVVLEKDVPGFGIGVQYVFE